MKATSFIMPDQRKKKVKAVAAGESSRHVDGSGAAPDVGVPLIDQSFLTSSLCMSLFLVKRRGGEWKTRGQRLMTSQKLSLLVDLCQLRVGASKQASPSKRQMGVLISCHRETALDTAGLRIFNFQNSQQPLIFCKDFTLASCSIR